MFNKMSEYLSMHSYTALAKFDIMAWGMSFYTAGSFPYYIHDGLDRDEIDMPSFALAASSTL